MLICCTTSSTSSQHGLLRSIPQHPRGALPDSTVFSTKRSMRAQENVGRRLEKFRTPLNNINIRSSTNRCSILAYPQAGRPHLLIHVRFPFYCSLERITFTGVHQCIHERFLSLGEFSRFSYASLAYILPRTHRDWRSARCYSACILYCTRACERWSFQHLLFRITSR